MRIAHIFVLSAVVLLSACASTPDPRSQPLVETNWSPEDYKYRVGAGDELGIRFPINPDLNAQVTIGPDGRGVFPLISAYKVSGLTIEEINATLTTAYGAFLRRPYLQTQIFSYAAGQVYVAGEVKQPGIKVIRGEFTVAQAIMSAGGFDEGAKPTAVVILRRRPGDGRALMRTVNVSDALKGWENANIQLLPGDVIYVPKSGIAKLDKFVRQYVTDALPFSLNYQLNANRTGILP